jgi:hypothetical protein
MPLAVRKGAADRSREFAVWRLALWLILLLAAFGVLQYQQHMQRIWVYLHASPAPGPADASILHGLLAWDMAYLLAGCLLIVLCAACILRQAWARTSLRVVLVLLALWMIVSGVLLLRQWQMFEQLPAVPGSAPLKQQAQRGIALALGFKLAAIAVLGWLAWRLGHPQVRAQFHTRRRH